MKAPAAPAPPLRVQLWSYNYDPEPTGIGPLSRVLAQALSQRGHRVEVVAAHPHYPEPRWERGWCPTGKCVAGCRSYVFPSGLEDPRRASGCVRSRSCGTWGAAK